ncbi:nucleotidyltransferase family protein [Pedobacter sp.]|uniref:nucleotidyltransferase family protein n=1 Tax=Pedobacter sp. TaxID=1411316 RepID=UPI003BAB324F
MAAVINKQTLITRLKSNSGKLKSFGIAKLSIFGSFVSGKPMAESDVDFLIEFLPEKKNYDNFINLSFYLEELLGRKVEIVTPQSLSKYIGPHILRNAEYVAL